MEQKHLITEEQHRLHIIKQVEILRKGAWETHTGGQAFQYMTVCQDFFKNNGTKLIELLTPEKKEHTDDKDKAPEGGTAAKTGG